MGNRGKVRAGVVVLAAVVVAMACLSLATGCERPVPAGATAGALDPSGRLHIVDLERGEVWRTLRLRSVAYDIAADPAVGCYLTAQAGGLGAATDDRLGIIGDRGAARPSYVRLPRENPTGVEVVSPGVAIVNHGIFSDQGAFVSVVDTKRRSVIATGAVPDNNGPLVAAAGAVWSSGVNAQTYRRSLRRVDSATLVSYEVLAPADFPIIEAFDGGHLYGWLSPKYGRGSVARFSAGGEAVEASRTLPLDGGCGDMALVAGRLVVADWAAEDLSDTGDTLHFLDPGTLEELGRLEVQGGACDVQPWGEKAVVASFRDSALLVVDPTTARVERRIELPKMELPFRIAVLD